MLFSKHMRASHLFIFLYCILMIGLLEKKNIRIESWIEIILCVKHMTTVDV